MLFPVFDSGALFGFGDGHAAMADGEVTQTGLETSMDVMFSVDVIKGYQSQGVREEDNDYIISFGVAVAAGGPEDADGAACDVD
jgi:acetamidase/formamidase